MKVFIVTKVAGSRPLTLLKLTPSQICFKNSAKITTLLLHCILENGVNKCAAPKCTSVSASNEKKQTAKFQFPLKNAELHKQWIRFINRRSWIAKKLSVRCELHFEEKYLRRGEKCALQWLMNPVPTVYPRKLLSKPSSLLTQQTIRSLPRKRSFLDK